MFFCCLKYKDVCLKYNQSDTNNIQIPAESLYLQLTGTGLYIIILFSMYF